MYEVFALIALMLGIPLIIGLSMKHPFWQKWKTEMEEKQAIIDRICEEREQQEELARRMALRNYIGLDKYVVEKETIIKTSLWKCEYCNTSNNGESLNCVHCGSPRKIGDE
jgi:hypothetical protein